MPRIIVFQHSEAGTPGRLGATLRDHGFKLDVLRADLSADQGGAGVPKDLDDVAGVVVLGGPQSVNDAHAWIDEECRFIREAHQAELPVVGICLGHQLIAKALGGEVTRMPKPECGFTRVHLTGPAQTEAMLGGIAWSSMQYQSHGDEVSTPPPGAVVLASNEACKVQAFRVGLRTLGFQYHFEADRPMISAICDRERTMLGEAGASPDEIAAQASEHYDRFATLANRLCVNLVTLAFACAHRLTA